MENKIRLRALKRKDRKTITILLRKLADKIGTNGITNIIISDVSGTQAAPPEENNADKMAVFTKIGIELLKQMLDLLDEDIAVWFADLAGMKIEDLDDAPFDFEADIIDQLISSPEVGDFFMHALRAFSWMKEYGRRARTEKTT